MVIQSRKSKRLRDTYIFKDEDIPIIKTNIYKFDELKDRFRELYNDPTNTYKDICIELSINPVTVMAWRDKLNLPKRSKGRYLEARKRVVELFNQGFKDYEAIASIVDIPLDSVMYYVGVEIAKKCRTTFACSYKALLPEYNNIDRAFKRAITPPKKRKIENRNAKT